MTMNNSFSSDINVKEILEQPLTNVQHVAASKELTPKIEKMNGIALLPEGANLRSQLVYARES